MTKTTFRDTPEAAAFIASADARRTSPEIMQAIVFFARNLDEAERVWDGEFGIVCHALDIWERVTQNGRRDPTDYCWGEAGNDWWSAIEKAEG